MDEAPLGAYIRQLFEPSAGPEVQVAWQGGEPRLRGLDFFRRSVELTTGTASRTSALVLVHNGDVYSCDHFVEPEHWRGNVKDTSLRTLVTSEKQRRFGQSKYVCSPPSSIHTLAGRLPHLKNRV